MNATARRTAEAAAGYREKYALEHGKPTKKMVNGHTLYIFKYSTSDPYQDANGATYDASRRAWID